MTFFCKVCGEIFKRNISLIRHRRCKNRTCGRYRTRNYCLSGSLISYLSKNSTLRILECSKCGKTFYHLKHLLIHMRIHTKSTPYKCEFCSKTFMLMVHFYHHLDSHREEDSDIKCEKCNGEVQELLRKFNRTESTVRSLTCLFCKKSRFSNVSQFTVHLRTHRLRTAVCSDCGCLSISFQAIVSYLQNRAALKRIGNRHYRPVGANGTKSIQCESCGRIFQTRHLLEIHLLSHISDPFFCCRNCQEVFRNGRLYMTHMKKCMRRKTLPLPDEILRNSSGMSDETFDCPYCKLRFSSPSQLQRHLPLHLAAKESKSDTESADDDFMVKDPTETRTNSNPTYTSAFVCPNCGQIFKEKDELRVHLKTDCPFDYNCKHCYKAFSRWSDLEQHINYHNCNKSQANSLYQRLCERTQLAEYEIRHLSSKQLYSCSQCYKSFVSNASLDTHVKLHLTGALISSRKNPNKILSNCSPNYADSGNRNRNPEKEKSDGDDCKSLSDRRCLCDVCGEVFFSLVNLNDHMKIHNGQELCEPIYTMANINNSRQPDIYPNQSPMMMFPPHSSLSTSCFLPGPDMNSNFTRIGNMIPGTHTSSFSTVQTNNVSIPTFASSNNVIPFIPSVNELKNVSYSDFVPPGLPFHVQNNRGSFFPIPSFDNRTSESNLPYGDCRDKLPPFPYNDCSRFNVFYSVPTQDDVSLANNKDKNNNQERNASIPTFICENRDKIISPLATSTHNNVNHVTVPQKINTDIPRSISDHQTVFLPEKENYFSQLSPKSNLGTNLDNRPFPVSIAMSKNTNFMSKSQTISVESASTKTSTNNIDNPNLEYPANEILINLPNLSQGPNLPGRTLPEIEPLNLCQTRNLGGGKFYNYPVHLDSKAFIPQQTPLNNLSNPQATYPVPLFWDESKSDFDMNFNVGNQCSNDENGDTIKFNSEFQNENIQSPLWSEPKTYYNMNQISFRDRNYDDVNGKVGKMNANKPPSFSTFLENRSKNMNSSLYENQNSVSENDSLKTASSHLENIPFLRLKPNYTFSNSISNIGDVRNSNKDSVGGDTTKGLKYQDPTLITARDPRDVAMMPSANGFASNQTGAGST